MATGTWREFEVGAASIAALAQTLWPGITALQAGQPVPPDSPTFSVAYLATVRRDGAPRLHPFCPILADGRLFAAIPKGSPKGWDLRRDPRCVIHALPGSEDDELCIRAQARDVTNEPETRARVLDVVSRSGVGGMIATVADDCLFEFELEQVDAATWIDIGQKGTHAERDQWRPATERDST